MPPVLDDRLPACIAAVSAGRDLIDVGGWMAEQLQV
jgi:hypothetical protein